MKFGVKTAVFFLGAFVAFPGGRTVVAESSQNSYQGIVARNVFALKPPPPPKTEEAPPPPPSNITLQGITSILGRRQVLFKVESLAKPGQPPGQGGGSFILGEGERQDDIEVVSIDEKAGLVTFKVGNMTQIKSMEKDAAKPSTTAAPMAVASANQGMPGVRSIQPPPSSASQGAGVTSVGGRGNNLRQIPSRNPRVTPAGEGVAGPQGTTTPAANPHNPNNLTPEEQTIMIEVERARTHDAVQRGDLPPLPITDITPGQEGNDSGAPGGPK